MTSNGLDTMGWQKVGTATIGLMVRSARRLSSPTRAPWGEFLINYAGSNGPRRIESMTAVPMHEAILVNAEWTGSVPRG